MYQVHQGSIYMSALKGLTYNPAMTIWLHLCLRGVLICPAYSLAWNLGSLSFPFLFPVGNLWEKGLSNMLLSPPILSELSKLDGLAGINGSRTALVPDVPC